MIVSWDHVILDRIVEVSAVLEELELSLRVGQDSPGKAENGKDRAGDIHWNVD